MRRHLWTGLQRLFVTPQKARLAYEIAGREKQILSGLDCRDGYSLYVGIPFALRYAATVPSVPALSMRGKII